MDNLPRVIALTGLAGAGKSSAARHLVERHGYARIPFAGPLKAMLRAIGLTDAQIDGPLKEKPAVLLMGQTPRYAMQRLGTEFGRDLIHPDLWVNLWRDQAEKVLEAGGRVVADDCRFPNEVETIRALGGKIIAIRTPDEQSPAPGSHASECLQVEPDAKVINGKVSLDDLRARIDGALLNVGGLDG
jgi:hypothetical protein